METGQPIKTPELGAKIRAARLRSGLSHDKLGARVGTSRQHLIKLEKGWHRPSDALLAKIAEATGQEPSFFDDGARREEQESGDDSAEAVRAMAEFHAQGLVSALFAAARAQAAA